MSHRTIMFLLTFFVDFNNLHFVCFQHTPHMFLPPVNTVTVPIGSSGLMR